MSTPSPNVGTTVLFYVNQFCTKVVAASVFHQSVTLSRANILVPGPLESYCLCSRDFVVSRVAKGRNISGKFPVHFHGKLSWGILETFHGNNGNYGN